MTNAQNDICPLKIGEQVPATLVKDIDNKTVNLNSVCQKPTVLIFFRGGWCPYCKKHLSAIQEAKEEIEKLGYQIIAITPDQISKLPKTIRKKDLEYTLLSDSKIEATKAFGLAFKVDDKTIRRYKKFNINLEKWSGEKHNNLPVPAVYIIKKGEVLFNYVNPNYKHRLKAETLIAVLKTL